MPPLLLILFGVIMIGVAVWGLISGKIIAGSNPDISSIKFFAGRDTSQAGVVNYSKWLVTLHLWTNLLTRRVSFLISNKRQTVICDTHFFE